MPRYIDADKLIAEYDRVHIGPSGGARKLMIDAPTEDVVPKSEVEKAVVGYIEKHLQYQRKKVDIPFTSRDMRNYQCGAIDVIEYFEELVADLKKKYTESGERVSNEK